MLVFRAWATCDGVIVSYYLTLRPPRVGQGSWFYDKRYLRSLKSGVGLFKL